MLPIKSRHFNPLTFQFEDREEWNSFYPTGYTPMIPETNKNDVEIARIKFETMKELVKPQERHQRVREVSEDLRTYMTTNPGKRMYRSSSYKRGWFGMYEAERMVVEYCD